MFWGGVRVGVRCACVCVDLCCDVKEKSWRRNEIGTLK